MFLDSAKLTGECIKNLIHELYPSIQYQFVLITSENDLANTDNGANKKMNELLNGLKNEFQSLTSYENKLVFPSVLKKFETNKQSDNTQQINIADLQQLTIGKEHRLMQMSDKLSSEIKKSKQSKKDSSIIKLTQIFKNDFAVQKSKWNQIISKL